MGNIKSKPARHTPASVSSDTKIPLHYFDDSPIFRSIVLNLMMRFDDVLDPARLRASLERLLGRDGWRKLGARLRMNRTRLKQVTKQAGGRLEYHVPEKFDDSRPAISYSQVEYDMAISEHPLASRMPKASSARTRPEILFDPSEFQGLMRRPDGPRELADYIYTDEPQLGLHIVVFRDATLVSLSWSHTLMDALGKEALLDAWSLVLQGRDDEVRPFVGFDTDPLAELGRRPTEPYKLRHRQLTGWRALMFGLRYMLALLWWPEEEHRTMCIPAAYLGALKATALEELRARSNITGNIGSGDGAEPFLSDGDVLCAWITRLVAISDLPGDSTRTVMINNAHGLRRVLAQDLLSPDRGVFTGNAVLSNFTILPASGVLQKPLSYTARAIRESLSNLGGREQVEALAALQRDSSISTRNYALFGDPGMRMITFSNWTRAKVFETDFSAAVVKPGLSPGTGTGTGTGTGIAYDGSGAGKPSFTQICGFTRGFSTRDAFPIIGRDAAGSYWVQGTLRKGLWARIGEEIAREAAHSGGPN